MSRSLLPCGFCRTPTVTGYCNADCRNEVEAMNIQTYPEPHIGPDNYTEWWGIRDTAKMRTHRLRMNGNTLCRNGQPLVYIPLPQGVDLPRCKQCQAMET